MNILFYTAYKPTALRGGTERASINVARKLRELYDWNCYALFAYDDELKLDDVFVAGCKIPDNGKPFTVLDQIERWNVDVVVDQGDFAFVNYMNENCTDSIKMIFAYHYAPEWEIINAKSSYSENLYDCLRSQNVREAMRSCIKLVFTPIVNCYKIHRVGTRFKQAGQKSDCVVLLSKCFIPQYRKYSPTIGVDNIRFIPNMLSYEHFATIEEISSKEKIVLIVARMEEKQKRISLALDIWKRVKSSPLSKGWVLRIVGDGGDLSRYKRIVDNEKIPDVKFLGRIDPYDEYLRSSIFVMTSISEGWGITLTEAQQLGCIPIAFDSYASVHDIIEDGVTGLLFPFGNCRAFANGMLGLMRNRSRREKMAEFAVRSSRRYEGRIIAEQWRALLLQLCES